MKSSTLDRARGCRSRDLEKKMMRAVCCQLGRHISTTLWGDYLRFRNCLFIWRRSTWNRLAGVVM